MLSRLAREFAAEIAAHDWSDAPYRTDRAGHRREDDGNRGGTVLTDRQTNAVRMNVMWVTAQVLLHADPNFGVVEFAAACGVEGPEGWITNGIRRWHGKGEVMAPGPVPAVR